MDTRKIDLLNIGLVIVSLLLAFWMPFALFLFSYAVLGPLHYMTEINWLDERNYFSKSKSTPWLLGIFVFLICLGSFYVDGSRTETFASFYHWAKTSFAGGLFEGLRTVLMHLAFLALVLAVALVAFRSWSLRLLVFVIGCLVSFLFKSSTNYLIIVGSLLPTIIHVSIFTGLFMLYGAMKSESRPGYGAVLVFILAHLIIMFWPIQASDYFLAKNGPVTERFVQSGFHNLLYQLGIILGLTSSSSKFIVNSELGVRLGIFLGFAYTYHYLNWFSKTSVIKWHQVSKRKLAWAIIIWIASIVLYAYDYKIGLMALLFLSFLHVVFEFPLNYVSIAGIASGLFKRVKGTGQSQKGMA
ncbi:MAG: hypothetical protein H6576_01405 [Lewinellaceae bacterium]|nr:hypothetical protein [Lewinellaceae bacterium]